MRATDTPPLPEVTDAHRRQAFALNAHKWPGVTFEEALRVDIRKKLIEVCAHALRTAEARADRRQQQYRAPRWSADILLGPRPCQRTSAKPPIDLKRLAAHDLDD